MSVNYTPPPLVVDGNIAYAIDVNGINTATDSAFTLLEGQVSDIEVAVAVWAQKAEKWAENPEDVEVEPGKYSALHHAAKALSSANAAASATSTAIDAANAAGDSAIAAGNSATTAGNAATAAAISASSAGINAAAADTSAISAASSALGASVSETNAAASETNAAASEAAALLSETNAATSETNAATSASNAAFSESEAATSALSAATSEAHAASSELAAYGYALDAQSVVLQDLSAIADTIPLVTPPLDAFLYDTSKDSDGGAWRNRCTGTSWYNETLNVTYRGSTRGFPEIALIVLTDDRVIIYDATDPDVPSWMVFVTGGTTSANSRMIGTAFQDLTSVSMMNGELCIGSKTADVRLHRINFIKDSHLSHSDTETNKYNGTIAERNDGKGYTVETTSGYFLVGTPVNKIAMTVRKDAPVDIISGLPYPTIGVATDAGVSIFDGTAGVGTVIDITGNTGGFLSSTNIAFCYDSSLYIDQGSTDQKWIYGFDVIPDQSTVINANSKTGTPISPDRWYDGAASVPGIELFYRNSTAGRTPITSLTPTECGLLIGNSQGLTLIKEDPSEPSEGMAAYITEDYNTGWMQGDVKLAALMDTTAETIGIDITTNHITNGDFTTGDITGWTDLSVGSESPSVSGGQLNLSRVDGSNQAYITQGITTVVGQTYSVSYDAISGTSHGIFIGTAPGALNIANVVNSDLTFKATTTTTYITVYNPSNGTTAVFDNISVKKIQNLIENGEISSDRAITLGDGFSISGGVIDCDGSQTDVSQVKFPLGSLDATKKHLLTYTITRTAGTIFPILFIDNKQAVGTIRATGGTFTEVIPVPTSVVANANEIWLQVNADFVGTIDNVLLYELDVPDRSRYYNHLRVVGELDKTAVATGSELVAYSGFSSSNYIDQVYNSTLDVGTGDFYISGWCKQTATATEYLFDRDTTSGSSNEVHLVTVANGLNFVINNITTSSLSTPFGIGAWVHFCCVRRSGVTEIYINGELDNTGAAAGNITNTSSIVRIGVSTTGTAPATNSSITEVRFSASAPSANQIKQMYMDEKKFFEANAKITLNNPFGNLGTLTDTAYDKKTESYKVTTNQNVVNELRGLMRLSDTSTGSAPLVFDGGITGQWDTSGLPSYTYEVSQPAFNLREEIQKKDIEIATLREMPIDFTFTVVAGAVTQFLEEGFKPIAVYDGGLKVSFTEVFDGYQHGVSYTAASTDLIVTAKRIL